MMPYVHKGMRLLTGKYRDILGLINRFIACTVNTSCALTVVPYSTGTSEGTVGRRLKVPRTTIVQSVHSSQEERFSASVYLS